MLALPDEASLSPTVPSYAKPEDSQPITDPAAGLEPEISPLFASPEQQSAPLFTEEFQQLIAPAKTDIASSPMAPPPAEQPVVQPISQEAIPTQPLPLPVQSEIDQPTEVEQCESLEVLLAQLNHSAPPTPPMSLGASNLGNLTEAQSPLAASPNNETALVDWELSPMETPALTNDWSLMPPAAPNNKSANRLSHEQTQASLSSDVAGPTNPNIEDQSLLPMASLADCFTTPETQQAPSEMASENTAALWSHQSELTPPQQSQPELSILDTLMSPGSGPYSTNGDALSPPEMHSETFGTISFTPESPEMANPDTSLAPTGFSEISLEPPFWEETETSIAFGELTPPSGMEQSQASVWEDELAPADLSLPSPLPSESLADNSLLFEPDTAVPDMADMEELTSLDANYEPEESEQLWCNAEDAISESADLNSSSSAYDLNHYDDPDEPSQMIDLDQDASESFTSTSEFFTKDALQSLNSLLSLPAAEEETAYMPETAYQEQTEIPNEEDFSRAAFLTGFNPIYHQEKLGMAANFGLGTMEEEPETAPPQLASIEPEMTWDAPSEELYPAPEETPVLMEMMHSPVEQPFNEIPEDIPYTDDYLPESSLPEALESLLNPVIEKPITSKPSILETISSKWNPQANPDNAKTDQVKRTSAQNPVSSSFSRMDPPYNGYSQDFPELTDLPMITGIKAPSLSQAMTNFEEEMLLQETRFIRQSINNLVERYFAQQEPDSSM